MSILDKLLGLALIEELTETAWWTETVFRELEQDVFDERDVDPEVAAPAVQPPGELA